MSKELKPCPFCGGEATTRRVYPIDKHYPLHEEDIKSPIVYVGCENCGIDIQYTPDFWNTRPAEDALKSVIAEIAATLAMGADLPEDDIFAMCKDAIGEKAILDRYNKKLRERASKLGTDTDVLTKGSEVKDE